MNRASKHFDLEQNLYIEGDNLEALKLLRQDYRDKVKLIYIDPPYNTGHQFVYSDKFTSQQWGSMMLHRLEAARELLSDDGAIFISIDQHEMIRLVGICDEVFGSVNRVAIISVINNLKGRSDNAFFATCHEFLLVYAKAIDKLSITGFPLSDDEVNDEYDQQDEIGRYKLIGFRKTGRAWKREERPNMFYPVLFKNQQFSTLPPHELVQLYDEQRGTFNDAYLLALTERCQRQGFQVIWPKNEQGVYGRWRWGIETFLAQKDSHLALNAAGTLCTKMRATLENGQLRMKAAKTVWYKPDYDTGSAARQLATLMGRADLFENPKSLTFIADIIKIATRKDSIVLDFFSGSSTTAHAVMQQNAEDGGCRKFIMVQRPDPTAARSAARQAGYHTICEIGEERIRRSGQLILAKQKERGDTQLINTDFRIEKLPQSH